MKNDMTHVTGWHDFFFFEPPSTFRAEDLETANRWQSTSPQSVLLKGPICGRPLECGGRMVSTTAAACTTTATAQGCTYCPVVLMPVLELDLCMF